MSSTDDLSKEDSVLRDTHGHISYEWEIKNFFDLPTKVDYGLASPTFMLSDAKCAFWIYPNGRTTKNSVGWIGLNLYKEFSPSEHRISFTLGIKAADGSAFKYLDGNEVFGNEYKGWRQPFLIQRSELLKSKDIVAPDGTLTVFCDARLLGGGGTAASTRSSGVTEARCEQQGVDNFRCQQCAETLSDNFKELFLSGRQGDVNIRVKNKEFVAHRLILTARSSVFRAMFEMDMAKRNSCAIDIDDCDPESFEDFLLFLYSGKLDVVSSSNALGLYPTAKKYDVKQLKEECAECLSREISVDSVCDVVHLATLHDETELLNTATQFFVDNANKIVTTPKWLSFMVEHYTIANELLVKLTNKYIN